MPLRKSVIPTLASSLNSPDIPDVYEMYKELDS